MPLQLFDIALPVFHLAEVSALHDHYVLSCDQLKIRRIQGPQLTIAITEAGTPAQVTLHRPAPRQSVAPVSAAGSRQSPGATPDSRVLSEMSSQRAAGS